MRGYYTQDVIQPCFLVHNVEFGHYDALSGELSGFYNYLAYVFREGEQEIHARHYLDRPDEVQLLINPLPLNDFRRRVLMFLVIRYPSIQYLGSEGYHPLPDAVRHEIEEAVAQHMKNNVL